MPRNSRTLKILFLSLALSSYRSMPIPIVPKYSSGMVIACLDPKEKAAET